MATGPEHQSDLERINPAVAVVRRLEEQMLEQGVDLNPDPTLITIMGDDRKPLVTIRRDGTVTYGEGVDLDDASRRFWDALAANIPPTHRASTEG